MAGCSEWVAAKRKGQFGLSRSSALERGRVTGWGGDLFVGGLS